MPPERDPRAFLPLTPTVFHVLLALATGERHGYGVIQDVAAATGERHGYGVIQDVAAATGGAVTLRTGTLYTILKRLLDEALIVESNRRPGPDEDDQRRRYYALTPLGRR